MIQDKDYIKRLIAQLAQALGKVLTDLLKSTSQGNVNEGIEIANQALKEELDFDLEKLIAIESDKLIDLLKAEKRLNNENMETLADIFVTMADNTQEDSKAKKIREQSLAIYEYLEDADTTTYSVERHSKIGQLKSQLS